MDVQELKNYIIDTDKVKYLLESLGCHNISCHHGSSNSYICASNPDGNNPSAITVYLNSNLTTINYTRQIGEKDTNDLFTLIEYIKQCNFFQALKWTCDTLGIDYYRNSISDITESGKLTKMLSAINRKKKHELEDDEIIKVYSEEILKYYWPHVNDLWKNDNISYSTQQEFEIGYDPETNRITIPIRSELGDLVGIKGRLFKKELHEGELKYLYLFLTPRRKILYGLHKTIPFVKEKNCVYIFEAEKSTLQLWSYGYKNSVATGGMEISKTQIEKLERLNCKIILCMDKDVKQKELEKIANKFIDGISVWAVIDDKNILDEKESPSDNQKKWEWLNKNCVYQIR